MSSSRDGNKNDKKKNKKKNVPEAVSQPGASRYNVKKPTAYVDHNTKTLEVVWPKDSKLGDSHLNGILQRLEEKRAREEAENQD